MSDESRIFRTNADSDPGASDAVKNEKTVLASSVEALAPEASPATVREQFTRHFRPIREWIGAHGDRPGAAVVAIGPDSVRGTAFLAVKAKVVSSAVFGRHSRADLHLGADRSLSLRHVALLLFPDDVAACRFRLLDLRSATAFVDERGRRLRALEADGPAFVRVGRYTLLAFTTGNGAEPWPDDAEAAWERIPDRLYLDEVETEAKSPRWEAERDRAWEVQDLPALSVPPTVVHHVAGPEMALHDLVDDDESPRGELLITSRRGAATVVLGQRALQSGVLLGRSRRCDAGRVLSDRAISRVHLLVIDIAGHLYAIDTASSNGVFDASERERVTPLVSGARVSLSDVAVVEWRAS